MREEELKDFGLDMDDVEGERLPLINASTANSRRNWCWKLKSRYSQSCVTFGPVIVCLVWMGILTSLLSSIFIPWLYSWSIENMLLFSHSSIFCLAITYILYPVLGYLGERWTRYYVIMTGTFIASGGCMLLLLSKIVSDDTMTLVLAITGTVAFSCGLGLFSANIIQFSAAQIPGASSQQLASLARWWAFTLSVGVDIGYSSGICMFLLPFNYESLVGYTMLGFIFFLSLVVIIIGVYFRRKFTIEPPRSVDPVKLIYQVIKYAWKHKYPERPSSFTYTDNNTPSRLDFGKERYGGPFTTDQVENVKSFGRILAVLLPSILFTHYALTVKDYTVNYIVSNQTASFSGWLLYSTNKNTFIIPILQLVVMPFFPWLVPSMLKRIWFGLFVNMLCCSVVTIFSFLVNTANVLDTLLVCFGYVGDVSSAIVIFSSLEFIFAQAPCDLQGILIGIWFIQFCGTLFSLVTTNKGLIFYCVTTGLLIMSLVAYSVAVYYYKYRVRNELSDINVQARIEEVYERDFRREDQETDTEESFSVSSI